MITYIIVFAFVIFNPWAFVSNKFMTPLMDYANTYLALVPLFTQTKNKITAMRAKRWLSQKGGHEFVAIDLMNFSLHGTSSLFHRKTAFLFPELSHWLSLLFLRCPL